jgi:methyl-accepting chemotaxis protein
MKVGTKLTVLVLLTMPGLIWLVSLGQMQIERVFNAANYSNVNSLPKVILLNQVLDELANIRTKTWQRLSFPDKDSRVEIEQTILESRKKIDDWLKQYERAFVADDRDRQLLSANRKTLEDYDALRARAFALTDQGKDQAARDLLMVNQEIVTKIYQSFGVHRQYNVELGQNKAMKAAEIQTDSLWSSLGIASLILIVIGVFGRFATRSIIDQLGCEPNDAVKYAHKIAVGDLSFAI